MASQDSDNALRIRPSIFNAWEHTKFLFSPRLTGFSSLDGFRGFFSIWMISFHAFMYMSHFVSSEDFHKGSSDSRFIFWLLGVTNVDGFFFLTGFLLAYPIFAQTAKKDDDAKAFSLQDWLYRRITRMVPVVAAVIFLNW